MTWGAGAISTKLILQKKTWRKKTWLLDFRIRDNWSAGCPCIQSHLPTTESAFYGPGGVGRRAIWEETLCLRFAWNLCGQVLLPRSNKKQQKNKRLEKDSFYWKKVTILGIFVKFTIFDSWVSWIPKIKRLQHILWAPMSSKRAQTTDKTFMRQFLQAKPAWTTFPNTINIKIKSKLSQYLLQKCNTNSNFDIAPPTPFCQKLCASLKRK